MQHTVGREALLNDEAQTTHNVRTPRQSWVGEPSSPRTKAVQSVRSVRPMITVSETASSCLPPRRDVAHSLLGCPVLKSGRRNPRCHGSAEEQRSDLSGTPFTVWLSDDDHRPKRPCPMIWASWVLRNQQVSPYSLSLGQFRPINDAKDA